MLLPFHRNLIMDKKRSKNVAELTYTCAIVTYSDLSVITLTRGTVTDGLGIITASVSVLST